MPGTIPRSAFRFETGYTLSEDLDVPQFGDDQLLVGRTLEQEPCNGIFVGKLAEYGSMHKNVWIDTNGAHVIYILGKRRSGKTHTLGVLAEGLAASSWVRQGNRLQAVLLLDTLNVFTTMPYLVEETFGPGHPESQLVARWGLASEQLNIVFFYPRGSSPPPKAESMEIAIRPSDLTAEDWAGLFGVDTFGDPIGQLLGELHDRVVAESQAETRTSSAKRTYSVDDMLHALDVSPDAARFEQRTIEAVRRRLRAIRRLAIFSERATPVTELFRPGQISIALLGSLELTVRGLLVGLLCRKIMKMRRIADQAERLAAVEAGEKGQYNNSTEQPQSTRLSIEGGLPRGWIIIDEAHNYVPAMGIIPSRDPLRTYVNEGRNIGLSIAVATQNPSALDASIRRNADILIAHPMSMRSDLQAAEAMVNTFVPDSFSHERGTPQSSRVFERLVRSLNTGYAVISTDQANRIFVAKIRPRITVHGGREY